jgi:hypothetical protein
MVDTIGTALGDARRSMTRIACATFTVGAVIGGALTFGGLAWLGGLVGGSDGGREALGVGIALAAAVADWRGVRIAPQIRRQVPERWRWRMPLALACGLYGVLLGLGFTTFVLAFAVWALAGVSFAAGSTPVGVLIGAAFGIGRALPIVWMAPRWSGHGAERLERMAAEPRLWLGLRRLDALGLCLCALFLAGAVAHAAPWPGQRVHSHPSRHVVQAVVPSATDPSTAGGDLAWQTVGGLGVLRSPSGATSALPGDLPALGPATLAWRARTGIAIADPGSLAVRASVPASGASAIAVSHGWLVYRAPAGGGVERLLGVSLLSPTAPPRAIALAPTGEIGRPALDGATVVFSLDTPTRARIDAFDLATRSRRTLRSATYGVSFANPSLLAGRLLYERTDRCRQELRIGALSTARGERVLLHLPSTVVRDPGYERSFEHAYNMGSVCRNRNFGRGASARLGPTALTPTAAYVTEIPANPAHARIVRRSRGGASAGAPTGASASAPADAAGGGGARSGADAGHGSTATKPATVNPKPPPKHWQPAVDAAIAYAHTRAGEVSFAVRTAHRLWGWRVTRTVPSASVLKAMLLVAYLDDPRVRDRPLTPADHSLIDPMIQRSDNTAASRVLEFVGPGGVYGVAARAGMRKFTLDPTIWGLSRIDAVDQARFFLHIDSHVVAPHRAVAMHLLATVTPSQRWGIGQLRLAGWRLYFKGGWGSGSGAVEHQVALLRHGNVRVSMAVLITNSPSHEYAKLTLRELFARLLRGVHSLIGPSAVVAGSR